MHKKILVIDIETSGFLPKGKIVEVGIVELNLDTGEINVLFDEVVNPFGDNLSEFSNSWILNNSNMTFDEVKNAKRSFNEARLDIQTIINSYPLGATAFNNKFDFGFLENYGIKFPRKQPCPMLLSTNVCKIAGKYGKYKWPSCTEAFKFFIKDADYVEAHRGASDAADEAKIVYELYKRGIFKLY